MANLEIATLVQQVQCHGSNLLSVVWRSYGQSSYDHVCIAYRFHLVHVIGVYGGIEAGVQVVQQVHHLHGRAVGGYRREANDVAEVDGDFGELFRLDGEAQLEPVGYGAVEW